MNIVRGKVTFDMLKSLEPKPISQFQQDLVDKIIKLPNNATNGDVINILFSDIGIIQTDLYTGIIEIDLDWWNAPYKGENNAE